MFVALSLLAQFIPQMQFSDGNFWENLLRSELEIMGTEAPRIFVFVKSGFAKEVVK